MQRWNDIKGLWWWKRHGLRRGVGGLFRRGRGLGRGGGQLRQGSNRRGGPGGHCGQEWATSGIIGSGYGVGVRNEDVFVGDVRLGNCLGKSRNASIAERGRRRSPESVFPVTSTTQKASPGRSAAPPSGNTNWSGLTISFFLFFLFFFFFFFFFLFSLLYSFNHLSFFFTFFCFLLSLLLVVIISPPQVTPPIDPVVLQVFFLSQLHHGRPESRSE